MFGGPCKVCAEKDKRSASLEAEIAFLRQLVRPAVNNNRISAMEYEADGVVSGHTDQIEIQTYQQASADEDAAILEERNAILSGTY